MFIALGRPPPSRHARTAERKIARDHFLDQFAEADAVRPAEPLPRLGRVPEQFVDLGRAEIARVDAHQDAATFFTDAALAGGLAFPTQRYPRLGKGEFDELAYRMRLSGGEHIVVGLLLLQHQPHALDIVAGMAPVAPRVEIADIEAVLAPPGDRRDRAGDLARDESLAAARPLVIEQDAVRGVQPIGLAIVHHDPVAVELGDAVRAARIERRALALRRLMRLAVKLRGRGLVEADGFVHAEDADALE